MMRTGWEFLVLSATGGLKVHFTLCDPLESLNTLK